LNAFKVLFIILLTWPYAVLIDCGTQYIEKAFSSHLPTPQTYGATWYVQSTFVPEWFVRGPFVRDDHKDIGSKPLAPQPVGSTIPTISQNLRPILTSQLFR
jgi:hypothetical protein